MVSSIPITTNIHMISNIHFYERIFFVETRLNTIAVPPTGGTPHDAVVKVPDCDIVVSEFERHSHCYVYFRTNTIWKGTKSLAMG